MIDQLESLVVKKEELLKESLNENKIQEEEIEELQEQIAAFRIQSTIATE